MLEVMYTKWEVNRLYALFLSDWYAYGMEIVLHFSC